MNIKIFIFWLPMIAIAFANAALREMIFMKHFNELKAHQLSTSTLIILCSLYVWFVFPFLNIKNDKQAFLFGLLWVLLTVLFEFSLGRFLNRPWTNLFKDYNIFSGRPWLLFLIWLFFLPYVCQIVRR